MEVEIWSSQLPAFFNMTKIKIPYQGPYQTFCFHLNIPNLIFLASNNKIAIINTIQKHIQYLYKVNDKIINVKHSDTLILIHTKTTFHLLNYRLQLIRYLQLNNQQILSIYSQQDYFRITYTGYHMKNQKFFKFKHQIKRPNTIYVRDILIYINQNNLYYSKNNCDPILLKIDQQIDLLNVSIKCIDIQNKYFLIWIQNSCIIYLSNDLIKVFLIKINNNFFLIRDYLFQQIQGYYKIFKIHNEGLVKIGKIINRGKGNIQDFFENQKDIYQIKRQRSQNRQSRIILRCEIQVQEDSIDMNKKVNDYVNMMPSRNHIRQLSNIEQELQESSNLSPGKTIQRLSDFCQLEYDNINILSEIDCDFRRVNSLLSQNNENTGLNHQKIFDKQKYVLKKQFIKLINETNHQQLIYKLNLVPNQKIDYAQFQKINLTPFIQILTQYIKTQYIKPQNILPHFQLILSNQYIKNLFISKLNNLTKSDLYEIIQYLQKQNQQEIKNFFYQHIIYKQYLKDTPTNFLIKKLSQEQKNIIIKFHPYVKNQELNVPNQFYTIILKNYFQNIQNLEDSSWLKIQQQTIYISNPRNILNVLLYLSQILGHDAIISVRQYLKTLINEGLIDIVENIIYVQKILQICQIQFQIFIDVIKEIQKQLYFRTNFLKNQLNIILNLIKDPTSNYKIKALTKLQLIEILQKFDINFTPQQIYTIQYNLNGFQFITRIINQQQITTVTNLQFQNIYQKIWIIESPQNLQLKYYTNQLLTLTQQVIFRCIQSGMYYEGYQYMVKIKPCLKQGLVIYSIIKFIENSSNKGLKKYLQIFVNCKIQQIFNLFEFLIFNNGQNYLQNKRSIQVEVFRCSFEIMEKYALEYRIYIQNKYIEKQDFLYLVYHNLQLVYHLADYFPFIDLDQLKTFITFMKQSKYYSKSILKLFSANTHNKSEIQQLPLIYKEPILQKWAPQKQKNKNYIDLLETQLQQKKIRKRKSQQYKTDGQLIGLQESRSEKKIKSYDFKRSFSNEQENSINELKQLIGKNKKEQIIEYLKQYYYQNRIQKLRNLTQNIKLPIVLYHLSELQTIQEFGLSFDYKKIFNFEFLRIENNEQCYRIIEKNIEYEINIKNFWVILYLVQKIIGNQFKNKIGIVFLKKEIEQNQFQNVQLIQRLTIIINEIHATKQQLEYLYQIVRYKKNYTNIPQYIYAKIQQLS